MQNKRELEGRLIEFAVHIHSIYKGMPHTYECNHISRQLVRSGTAPAAIYGEAQFAESRADFIHKMKVALKELQETRIWLIIIRKTKIFKDIAIVEKGLVEVNELISIFVASVKTASRN
jgi:four helix bundle protein